MSIISLLYALEIGSGMIRERLKVPTNKQIEVAVGWTWTYLLQNRPDAFTRSSVL